MGSVEGAAALCGVLIEPAAKQPAESIDSSAGISFVIGPGSLAIMRVCGFTHWHGEADDDPGGDGDIVIDISYWLDSEN